MEKDQIYEIMRNNPVIYLATIDKDQPRVRAILLYKADDAGIIFHTGPIKEVHQQLLDNPNVQLCFYDHAQNIQIRVRGAVELVEDDNLKEEISNHPTRIFMNSWRENCNTLEEFYGMFSIFRLKNGIANVWTFESNFALKEDIQL